MTRFWIGLWLLSASWLFGVDYFFPGNAGAWLILTLLGTVAICLSAHSPKASGGDAPGACPEPAEVAAPKSSPAACPELVKRWSVGCALALVPAALFLPWPFRMAPLLLGLGLLLTAVPKAGRSCRALSSGATSAGLILLVQALVLLAYKHGTARSHELPWPLVQLLVAIVRLMGVDAGTDGSHLVLPTMRENHTLAATWELFLDPTTCLFLAGGLTVLLLSRGGTRGEPSAPALAPDATTLDPGGLPRAGRGGAAKRPKAGGRKHREPTPPERRWNIPGLGLVPRPVWLLLLAVVCWVPWRAGLTSAWLLQRALRTDYEAPLNLMNLFWSPWTHLFLLVPVVLLAALWTAKLPRSIIRPLLDGASPQRVRLGAAGSACAAVVMLSLAALWDPIGVRKPGRIAVDEFHSKWEPTQRPMDTEWYGHLSGYNYACLYDLCSKIYDMSRLTNALTDANLAGLDVLILKVPTERFASEEVDAVVRYVERGGGLLLVGEHTDVFGTGYNLNTVSRRFGFTFRYDCLFGTQSFFDQSYVPWVSPHPALRYLRHLDFATSCSIDTGTSRGRGVIVSAGLKNSLADYHANNYYPQAVDHAGMRYGAFVQLWSVRHGRGRVLAFTDSTIFSNFSTFEPGKRELFLGMLEWLNRQDRVGDPRRWLLLVGMALLAWCARLGFQRPEVRATLIAAGVLGWTLTSLGLVSHQRAAMPEPKAVRPWTWVAVDRTVCDTPLSKGGFIAGKPDGFGIFERWILRLGYFIKRETGPAAFNADATVFFYPTKPVTPAFREALVRYVERGGKVLVLDSPKNEKSTAAGLLEPFGLSRKPGPSRSGNLSSPAGWPSVPIEAAQEMVGGRPLFELDGVSVGAVARRGKGMVVAIGFGSRFADTHMGATGDVEPDAALRKVFDLQFALMRGMIADKLPEKSATVEGHTNGVAGYQPRARP